MDELSLSIRVNWLIGDMHEIFGAIDEKCSPNLDYCPTIDSEELPIVVALIDPDGWYDHFDSREMNDVGLSTCRFLSENGHILPKSLQDASMEQYLEYIQAHADKILDDVREIAEGYYEEYIGRKFKS